MSKSSRTFKISKKGLIIALLVILGFSSFSTLQARAEEPEVGVQNEGVLLPEFNPLGRISPYGNNDALIRNSWGAVLSASHGLNDDEWVHRSSFNNPEKPEGNFREITSWPFTYLGVNFRGEINLGSYDYFGALTYSVSKTATATEPLKRYTAVYKNGGGTTAREMVIDTTTGKGLFPVDFNRLGKIKVTPGQPGVSGKVGAYTQTISVNGENTEAVQLRVQSAALTAPSVMIETRKTFVPLGNGNVRIYLEVRKPMGLSNDAKIGFFESLDTELKITGMLRVDSVPIYNYKDGQGAYISTIKPGVVTDEEAFKVVFTPVDGERVGGQMAFDNYAGERYGYSSGSPSSAQKLFGSGRFEAIGDETNTSRDSVLYDEGSTGDSSVLFKWMPVSMLGNQVRTMAFEMALRRMTPPTFTLEQENKKFTISEGEKLPISGTWRDKDSYDVDVFYRVYQGTTPPANLGWTAADDGAFHGENVDVTYPWSTKLKQEQIGTPSAKPYVVEVRMKDNPGDDFSKETRKFEVIVDKKSTVTTKHLDLLEFEKNPSKIKEISPAVIDHYGTADIGKPYVGSKLTPAVAKSLGYQYVKRDITSSLESGTIDGTNKEVRHLYKKKEITVYTEHWISGKPNPMKRESEVIIVGEGYTTSPLDESETVPLEGVVWDGVTPANASKTSVPLDDWNDIIVKYYYKQGGVEVIKAPDVDFGKVNLSAFGSETYYDNEVSMKISDKRKNKSTPWKVGITLVTDFTKSTGEKIEDVLYFKKLDGSDSVQLSTTKSVDVYVQNPPSTGNAIKETEVKWGGSGKNEGLYMKLLPGNYYVPGDYTAKLKWAISNVP